MPLSNDEIEMLREKWKAGLVWTRSAIWSPDGVHL